MSYNWFTFSKPFLISQHLRYLSKTCSPLPRSLSFGLYFTLGFLWCPCCNFCLSLHDVGEFCAVQGGARGRGILSVASANSLSTARQLIAINSNRFADLTMPFGRWLSRNSVMLVEGKTVWWQVFFQCVNRKCYVLLTVQGWLG